MYLEYYLNKLNYQDIPNFLPKYLLSPSLIRLKNIGYFCGMDYASNNIYDFKEYISRFDHSLTTSLLTYKLTKNKILTLAALFHDISTPCFSHVIDYMNEDYINQESTEEYTAKIMYNDKYLQTCLTKDNINIYDIINFKNYSIVDNRRPKMCADRLDGIILTGSIWTKNITKDDIANIIDDMIIYKNEDNQDEIGFKTIHIANRVFNINQTIDEYCHSKEDNYMMMLLAKIAKLSIEKGYITYDNLYTYSEQFILTILNTINDMELQSYLYTFKNITKDDIPNTEYPKIKTRSINPLVNGIRINRL